MTFKKYFEFEYPFIRMDIQIYWKVFDYNDEPKPEYEP